MGNNDMKGVITGNGISLEQAAAADHAFRSLEILDCIFKGLDIGINAVWAYDGVFLRNKFVVPDAANGEAITLAANTEGCMVDDNRAMNGGDAAMTRNPYRDLSGAPAGAGNHWGQNFAGAAVAALPVCA